MRLLLHPPFLLRLGARVDLLLSHQLFSLRSHPGSLCISMALHDLLLAQLLCQLSFSLL